MVEILEHPAFRLGQLQQRTVHPVIGVHQGRIACGSNRPEHVIGTRLNLDYIHRFAAATQSDAQAILMAVAIGSPEHARRCAENQMGSIYTIGLEQFDHLLGDDIRNLDSRSIIAAIVRMFEELAKALREGDPARDWIEKGSANLRAKRPKPGR